MKMRRRIEILQVLPTLSPADAVLEKAYVVHKLWLATDRAAFLAALGAEVRAVVTTGGGGAKAEVIDSLPALEIISCFGVGVDAIDIPLCKARGIAVTNTPDVLTNDVADMAIGLLLATLRRLPQGDRFVRSGKWLAGNFPLSDALGGKVMGIVGMGRIGQAIGHRAEAFGVRVVYHGPRQKPDLPQRYYPDLRKMAQESDILMVACPGGAATRNLVDAGVLHALGPQGYLINIARGSVVDEPALVTALQAGKLAGAGLDVFADEPKTPELLWAMENVVLQPHAGSATHQTRAAMGDLVVRNLAAHFSGEPLLTRYA